ncbi:MAG TPA: XRE family transcriptional regulator [Pseudonocardiaceae bacterium]|jgi:transcriptional regulator with XRE-family HTH domain|nr:XRE family transcriptional regulator [Pseudonocardiaceae bacterium]
MTKDFGWADVGERIRAARLSAGMSQSDLGNHIGLDRTMIAKIEAGARRVDALELDGLSETLGLPLGHFLRRSPAVLSRRVDTLDDTATEASGNMYRLEALLADWLLDVRQLVDFDVLEVPDVVNYPHPVDSQPAAQDAALWLRTRLGLGVRPIGTLIEISERAGQMTLVADLPGDGASLVQDGIAVAVVSAHGDPGRRRTTAAHELGHLVLGDEYSSDLGVNASRQEREAVINSFAAELLLPRSAVAAQCGNGAPSRQSLVELAATYRTSWSLVLQQSVRVGAIDRADLPRWRQNPTHAEFMDAIGWTPQPDLESVQVPPSYARGVLAAWRQHRITSGRAVELMHGQISDTDLPAEDSEIAP